ncbi:MAG: hypothetical protein K2X11_01970 [Acetobacteraceae bacterium]|nr:hypothetical protein [Acetobacteraceae bacterium]
MRDTEMACVTAARGDRLRRNTCLRAEQLGSDQARARWDELPPARQRACLGRAQRGPAEAFYARLGACVADGRQAQRLEAEPPRFRS